MSENAFDGARWITSPTPQPGSGPTPLFRRAFRLDAQPTRARLRLCGLGHFESRVNGARVGDDQLAPGWTNYRKTCLYLTRDVTALLRAGENVLGVMLGNGMYHVAGGRYTKFKGSFGPPKLIARLDLEFADREPQRVVSDGDWRVATGPITFSCIYGGEDYDARLERRGWDTPEFDDRPWSNAQACDGPGGELVEQRYPPIKVMQTFTAHGFATPADGVRVYDLGQNASGWPALTVFADRPGATVTLKTGELLDEHGRVSQKNTGGPVKFTYTARGDSSPERWHPRFSLTGFRYVEASGDLDAIAKVESHFVHNSAPTVGGFECSNEQFNRTHALICAAIKSNTHSVFTDCPHREKLGWLEQIHLLAPSILYNFGDAALYAKAMRDIRDAQHDNGMVPTIAPQYTEFKPPWDIFNDSPEWGGACVLAPWFVLQHTGDASIVRENYDVMRRYVDYLATRADAEGIIAYGLSDWYDIGPGDPGFCKNTTLGVTATATYVQCLQAMTRFATLLGKPEDAADFGQRIEHTTHAFNLRFFDRENGRYDKGSQTAQAMPLALGMVEPGHERGVLDALIADLKEKRLTAGDVGFRYVLVALARAGRSDVIFDLVNSTEPASYGGQLARGMTALAEAWDANPKSSLNHMMLGHAEEWFYAHLAGIQIDLTAADDQPQVVIAPAIVGDVQWCRAHHDVPAGRISVAWERQGDRATVRATIPNGLRAAARVDGQLRPLASGDQSFDVARATSP